MDQATQYAIDRIQHSRVEGKFYREIAERLKVDDVTLPGGIKSWTLNSVHDFAAAHEIDSPRADVELGPSTVLGEIEMVLNMNVSDSRKLSLITKILP